MEMWIGIDVSCIYSIAFGVWISEGAEYHDMILDIYTSSLE